MLQTIEGAGDPIATQPARPKTLKRNESESSYDSVIAKESRELILQTKLIVVELLQVKDYCAFKNRRQTIFLLWLRIEVYIFWNFKQHI